MSIHEIVKAKFTELDVTDDNEVDEFILAIAETEEYENDVANEMDYDFKPLLDGMATTDPPSVKDQLMFIQNDIRKNAVNLYNKIIEDLAEQPNTEPEDPMDICKRQWELHRDD